MEYGEITAVRRGTRLILDSRAQFSVLNVMAVILLVALVVTGVGTLFEGF